MLSAIEFESVSLPPIELMNFDEVVERARQSRKNDFMFDKDAEEPPLQFMDLYYPHRDCHYLVICEADQQISAAAAIKLGKRHIELDTISVHDEFLSRGNATRLLFAIMTLAKQQNKTLRISNMLYDGRMFFTEVLPGMHHQHFPDIMISINNQKARDARLPYTFPRMAEYEDYAYA